MKNLVMTVAAAATMLFAVQNTNAQETSGEVAMNETQVQAPVQDGFEKIEASTLPEVVSNEITADKAGATVTEAFMNAELSVYKLVLAVEGQEPETAYINAEGKWVTIK